MRRCYISKNPAANGKKALTHYLGATRQGSGNDVADSACVCARPVFPRTKGRGWSRAGSPGARSYLKLPRCRTDCEPCQKEIFGTGWKPVDDEAPSFSNKTPAPSRDYSRPGISKMACVPHVAMARRISSMSAKKDDLTVRSNENRSQPAPPPPPQPQRRAGSTQWWVVCPAGLLRAIDGRETR